MIHHTSRSPSRELAGLGVLCMTGAILFYAQRDIRQALWPRDSVAPAPLGHCPLIRDTVPCSAGDQRRRIYGVPGLGRMCLETGGRDLIKSVLKAGAVWEPEVAQALKRHIRPGDLVVDVGAHIGAHTLLMSRLVGPAGRVVAFEPQTKIYQELLANLELNGVRNVDAHFAALGDREGRVTMDAAAEGNEGGTGIGAGGNIVELRTLDSYRLQRVALLKIDVEGAEESVLLGARTTILRDRPLIAIEIVGGSDFETASPETKKVIRARLALVEGLGYSLRKLDSHNYFATPASPPSAD